MTDKIFIDTNILIYSVTSDLPRSEIAKNFLRQDSEFNISFQIIGEFVSACQRKKIITQEEIQKSVKEYLLDFQIQLISDSTVLAALDLQSKYHLSNWDALVAATALEANCSLLITEDLQDGLVIDKSLTIKNPFADSKISVSS